MATLPAFLKRPEAPEGFTKRESAPRPAPARAERDPFQLRALPHEDVYFHCKKIDNTRLVRDADPKARGACWSAIGVAALAVALCTGVLVPSGLSTLAGYKLESLRAEEQRLRDERRTLELQEAELLAPERLERLAKDQNLVTPQSDQVVHLDGNKPSSSVAMVNQQ
jgi:cell division protein FtsL